MEFVSFFKINERNTFSSILKILLKFSNPFGNIENVISIKLPLLWLLIRYAKFLFPLEITEISEPPKVCNSLAYLNAQVFNSLSINSH